MYPACMLLMSIGGLGARSAEATGLSDRLEKQSGTTCFLPGTWTGVKLKRRVRNLWPNSRGLVMVQSSCRPKMERRGL